MGPLSRSLAPLVDMAALTVEDVSKLKVAELKKELKALGLSVDGKKNELQERLEEAIAGGADTSMVEDVDLEVDADEELDAEEEDELLKESEESKESGESAESEEPTITKHAPITFSADSETKVKTAQELADEAKIAARVARFGLVEPPAKKKKEEKTENKENKKEKVVKKKEPKIKMPKEEVDLEKLKARAARFGEACPKDLTDLVKKNERAERFKNGTSEPETNGKAEEPTAMEES